MNAVPSLAGALWLRPGMPRPHNLRSTRPDAVARVARGLPAERLPATLGSLFSLCGHAHRLCAGMAVNAALGRDVSVDRTRLARETLREHLRRIVLDWPRQLGPASPADTEDAARALARCPVFAATPADPGAWLQAHLIGLPLAEWLAAWEHDPAAWLSAWTRATALDAPRWLDRCPATDVTLPATPALHVHADRDELRRFAATETREPRWRGACAETGVWTRSNETSAARLNSARLRLGARIAEVVRLALPDAPRRSGTQWLSAGALPLAGGEAIAWVEMARGLLIHHVRLDGADEAARVAECRVIAPTDWNFHPHGAVAATLESPTVDLPPLLAAYDACVPTHVETPMPGELADA